jgi:signal transduction histidine kinase
VFGLFHRLHDYRDYPGTGIGLAIVQKSVERMGGRIELKSTPQKGTTFSIRLRAALV